ncbi:formate dehydrogenase accessory sulfurtransferase FdhD [Porticoccaceae bacterium]|nr:formate dehydrogenase accessory sulfurtransferase FdhD [Porticoccaceae bacterium]
MEGSDKVSRVIWKAGETVEGTDWVATETAVALVYNGISHVVMMATPADLEDFALGFSLSEGILQSAKQLLDCEVTETDKGIELALTITAEPFAKLKEKRRNLVGRTGCGLCGAESLDQAITEPAMVTTELTLSHEALQKASSALAAQQKLQQQTGAVHGAAYCNQQGEILLVREDVGRHNALDKLLGALAKKQHEQDKEQQQEQAQDKEPGFVLITSRASYEMVAKTTSANIPLLAAVSAPTSLAIELAEKSGLTLVGFTRTGRHVVYANGQRIN